MIVLRVTSWFLRKTTELLELPWPSKPAPQLLVTPAVPVAAPKLTDVPTKPETK
jgi:hypothetical protein